MDKLPSPCVRNCCLDDSDICVGCGRSYDEILAWHNVGIDGQREILERAGVRLMGLRGAGSELSELQSSKRQLSKPQPSKPQPSKPQRPKSELSKAPDIEKPKNG
ncbi:DUF1289 domain-containing protein [Shewanella sp. JM162201]|uniref:DUF1289 domain-containing protein n=1 Tax=Shewanella jiangmenensis TaxID=2837387 RepID=A0ABS5V5P5_9GAMM|nr:DUF1289 domain-containing protein [Shewanella jiangmenensis]